MKIVQTVKKLFSFKLMRKKLLTQKQKNKIAIDYIRQAREHYDDESKQPTVGDKIGATMNSLELMVIEAKLLTGQLDATDDLLVALEEMLIKNI